MKNLTLGSDVIFGQVSTENAINQHVLVTGNSGSGKTTLVKMLLNQIGKSFATVVIDVSGDYTDDLNHEKVSIDLFSELIHAKEPELSANNFVSLLDCLITRKKDQVELRKALCQYLIEQKEDFDIRKFSSWLNQNDTYQNKDFSFEINIFSKYFTDGVQKPWSEIIDCRENVVIMLAHVDRKYLTALAEIIMESLYRACRNYPEKAGVFLIADEVQNLKNNNFCALGNILREGRKYGLNFVASIQSLSYVRPEFRGIYDEVAIRIFFSPGELEKKQISKLVNKKVKKEIMNRIGRMGKGKYVVNIKENSGIHNYYNCSVEGSADDSACN